VSNWFVALPVDPGRWFAQLPPPPHGVRSFHPDDLHVTIAFFGPVDEAGARRGFDALAWELGSLEVTLGEVVPMGSSRRPSAYSAVLREGRAAVEAAMGPARERACAAAGVEPDRRPPKAHVTIARPLKSASDLERAEGLRWSSSLELGAPRVRLERVALYGWSLERRAGPLFRIVAEAQLAAHD
jgi:RNA 2',3'-cyclic 3'-phosphodiesterase